MYILVVADYFTRWTEAYPIHNQEAIIVAKRLVNEFICRFGVPLQIFTDQGEQFESQLFCEMCHLLAISKTRTSAYHPQSDGMVEKFNRTLASMLNESVCEGCPCDSGDDGILFHYTENHQCIAKQENYGSRSEYAHI